ncbi:MAG: tRNA (adenosine(37)-N6)-threonylcarbamoyltransferase complex transferase subunit TsaD [Pseudomonadota bacterium]|nr:tRNA (adenosine(37)-N6)-threonylcarbamoyltransferase complex transferase subunit TsaD [Pseudomonadota bacterium]MDE3038453.1 tRNA (adenosine(37)-N6)-threonylcarbamoyltransferase complex transferase subunit TsaD [Pseudomonadota bacterium]
MALILGIETSCDETAAAVVSDAKEIRANIVLSQTAEHLPYGGVVPEIAARAHLNHIESVIGQALGKADARLSDMDAIAATGGPGLIGGVIVGVMTAKAIASVAGKPFIAVNHLEGHALTVRLTNDVAFPFLLLLVSGGHCQFLIVEGVGRYQRLGGTVDDALGECFDKVAKMLGLPYPGGPAVEKLARQGNEHAYAFPVPMKGREGCDFSFSGLKTAVRQAVREMSGAGYQASDEKDTSVSRQPSPDTRIADLCSSFQRAAAESLCDRAKNAIRLFRERCPQGTAFILSGGVAANQYLRGRLEKTTRGFGMELIAPPVALCTDNAAMIAWAGIERFRLGMVDGLDFEPKARWPLAF